MARDGKGSGAASFNKREADDQDKDTGGDEEEECVWCGHEKMIWERDGKLGTNQGFSLSVCRAGAASVTFRDLDADDFRHPLDRQNTLLLRAIPGLNDIGKALL
ncbi:hypothetical protein HAX54_048350, partial [Datura stramonium]|nr:hypothetical protein [Datura stramonium]